MVVRPGGWCLLTIYRCALFCFAAVLFVVAKELIIHVRFNSSCLLNVHKSTAINRIFETIYITRTFLMYKRLVYLNTFAPSGG